MTAVVFDSDYDLTDLSREQLAILGREYMLYGFHVTRVGLGYVHLGFGSDEREALAIAEWLGASPTYTLRMQRALGFAGGDDVPTIYKGLQLDCGFTHQYMDVAYDLQSETYGEFWLNSCGALLDVEPMGEDLVVSMCHHIEDPTFDGTAVATNPRARIRPIHRPPRTPAGRSPHCHWTVKIDLANDPILENELQVKVRESRLGQLPTADPQGTWEPGGIDDYSGEFLPDFELEDLGHRALVLALGEFSVQSHLLLRSMLLTLAERQSEDAAIELARNAAVGANWIGSERLRKALDLRDGLDAILRVLQLHPAFPPGYAPFTVERVDEGRARITFDPAGEAFQEGDPYSWFALLETGDDAGLAALVQGVDARARVESAGPLAWDVVLDPAAEALPDPEPVQIGRIGSVAGFVFITPKELRT